MATQITSEQLQEFTSIIDSYLKSSDLSTVTARIVRKHLEQAVGYDLSHLKSPVKELIEQRFDSILAEQSSPAEPNAKEDNYEGYNDHEFAPSVSASPGVPMKRKHDDSAYDAKLAAKLHQELNSARPSRSTSTQKKNTQTKARSVKKSKPVVDSDGTADEGESEKKKRAINRNNPFNAPMQLSEALSNLIGRTECSRPECVKYIWAYVKENGLQDPDDKRYIICDDTMKQVFNNASRVHMFTMNKVLSHHLYPLPKAEEA